MMAGTAIFTCSICGEPSTEICTFCTKDACGNHRCDRCKRCSDCCECEVPLSEGEAPAELEAAAATEPEPAVVIESSEVELIVEEPGALETGEELPFEELPEPELETESFTPESSTPEPSEPESSAPQNPPYPEPGEHQH